MKRRVCLFLALVLMLGLVSCATPAKVEKMIDELGTVSDAKDSTKELLEKAEKAYESLDAEKKNEVPNYKDLIDARRRFDYFAFIEQVRARSTEENPSTSEKHFYSEEQTFNVYYDADTKKPVAASHSYRVMIFQDINETGQGHDKIAYYLVNDNGSLNKLGVSNSGAETRFNDFIEDREVICVREVDDLELVWNSEN